METLSRPRWLVIMFACMWVAWFDFGLQTTTGAFFDVMLDYYQSDRTTTASVLALFNAINQGFGVIVGLLIHRFGIANIAFVGSILVPAGFFFSMFATSIYQIMIFFGVITAMGVSMMFISSTAMLRKACSGSYAKWLPFCLTMHSSCISFAGLTLPYLIHFLDETFALPGTFLAFSGILSNNLCVSVLFFCVERNSILEKKEEIIDIDTEETRTSRDNIDKMICHENTFVIQNENIACDNNNRSTYKSDTKDSSECVHSEELSHHNKSVHTADTTDARHRHIKLIEEATHNDDKKVSETYGLNKSALSRDYNSIGFTEGCKATEHPVVVVEGVHSENEKNTLSDEMEGTNRPLCVSLSHVKEAAFGHVTLVFTCVICAVSLVLGTQNSYLTVVVDVFESKGFSLDLAYNAYIPLNVCALICRILPGVITMVDPIWFVAIYSMCGSVGQVLILVSSNYVVCLVGVGMTGMTMGGVISAATIVLAQSIDASKFAVAYGQILTGIGFMTTATAPAYGAIMDANQNYDMVLTATAIAQAVGALMSVLGWILKRTKS